MDVYSVQRDIDQLVNWNMELFKKRLLFNDVMKDDLTDLAYKYQLVGERNYRMGHHKGYINVMWLDQNSNPVLAIEIDTSLRLKSIDKLASLPSHVERLWICCSPYKININRYENFIDGFVMKYETRFQRNQTHNRLRLFP